MKYKGNLGISAIPALLAVICFAIAWFGKDDTPKHAYVFFVTGGFMSASALILNVGKMDERTRLIRAASLIAIGLAVMLYGKTQFLNGVI